MTEKNAYKQKIEAQLSEWKADIDKLKAKLMHADADAKIKTEKEISTLEMRYEATKVKLRELADASDEAWGSLKKGLETSMDTMKNAYNEAKSKF